ncbi:hypothetical protein NQ315_011356 [Exocentrus adspersus]|uniref:DNA-directed DNA polymerase n=1 Tax=Exocentrus adspersus TaxID=1586481 RepID=A0AAV8VJG7_9CUCU|nr:hypothetical protein NQ315_011356 [Exocentrus adspersus]
MQDLKITLKFCHWCSEYYVKSHASSHLKSLTHKKKSQTEIEPGVYMVKSAFNEKISTYRFMPQTEGIHINIEVFLAQMKEKLRKLVTTQVQKNSIKLNLELFGSYAVLSNSTETDEDIDENGFKQQVKSFNSRYEIVTISSDFDAIYSKFIDILKTKSETFQDKDSGWHLITFLYLEASLVTFNPLKAGTFIRTPQDIARKQAIVNVQNDDNECFRWAILSSLHPVRKNPNRVSNYRKYYDELNFDNITFPVSLSGIRRFENQNDCSINVFGLEKKKKKKSGQIKHEVVGPYYHTANKKEKHINLLYLQTDGIPDGHYCWISNISRLVNAQMSKNGHKRFICDGCLVSFSKEDGLKTHLERGDCAKVCTVLPKEEEKYLCFTDYHKSYTVPFTIYADFETVLKPIHGCSSDPTNKYTTNSHVHQPHSFCYYVKCAFDDSLSFLRQYRGKDCARIFVKWLTEDARKLYADYFKDVVPMKPLSEEEMLRHESATDCFICGEPFPSPLDNSLESQNMCKVRDHDHILGTYRGAAHMSCNLNYKLPNFIPVLFHNASHYDMHLFVQELAAQLKSIDVIAQNKEKYISVSAKVSVDDGETPPDIDNEWIDGHHEGLDQGAEDADDDDEYVKAMTTNKKYISLRFLDSFRFMACSLDTLAKNLEPHQFVATRKVFQSSEHFDLMMKKGVFPYEYVDSYEKLEDTVELPSREHFYSSLTETAISEEDYTYAVKVWNAFKCRTLAEYSDIYLKTDVVLLADVFEAFRKVCQDTYQLDPCQFYTLPGLSWAAMMKYTKVKLELLTDVDMLHFIRRSIRGGVAGCIQRHATANNPYMPAKELLDEDFAHLSYRPEEDIRYLLYLDANNLYGSAMSQYLPHSNFKWLSPDEIANFDITQQQCSNPNSDVGYILEVDMTYGQELHDLHDELPFCPENITPPIEGKRQVKLIPNLFNKNKYVLHYRNLYQAIQHGLKVDKIHRILSFNQSNWLQPYIDLNTKRRQAAKNAFEKDMYKLLVNAIFGKCMEAVEKHLNIRLVTRWKNYTKSRGAESLIASPHFHSLSIFNENFVAIQLHKPKVFFNKPVYIGFSVLDISKTTMYSFHYDYIKKLYGNNNAKLLYTDTDSLIYSIKTDDVYADIKSNISKFDTSNYKPDNPYGIPLVNKAVLGCFKDEANGRPMLEFLGLRSKLYDYVLADNTVVKKAKGIKKCVTKRLHHNAYRNCLFNKKIVLCKQSIFKSIKHVIHTQVVNKVGLSWQDDKRFILPDGIHTLSWGNYRINEGQ